MDLDDVDRVDKWEKIKKLGKGSFGELWMGRDTRTGELVAIKFERRDIPNPQLPLEFDFYRKLIGLTCVPKMYKILPVNPTYHALVMELLSKSLENLLDICDRRFSLRTVLKLAIQMISTMEQLHTRGIIHRDIKPDNFMFGRRETGKDKTLFIIDFGLAKEYREGEAKAHIKYHENKPLLGTGRYMSINAHKRNEQSRRDDLESIGYLFMYFLNGKLPWMGIDADNNVQRNEMIREKKERIPLSELVNPHPHEFAFYISYVRKLGFADDPDYNYLRELFVKCAVRRKIDLSKVIYDWDKVFSDSVNMKTAAGSNMKQKLLKRSE